MSKIRKILSGMLTAALVLTAVSLLHTEQAYAPMDEFNTYYTAYKEQNKDEEHPKVMILMGLPGSYIIAAENSYVGSLVEMAGGENVYAGTDKQFLNVNTEDMKTKEPDIILRTAHALPDRVIGLKDGYVIMQGAPEEAVTEASIRDLYGIHLPVRDIEGQRIVMTSAPISEVRNETSRMIPEEIQEETEQTASEET